MKLGLYAVYDVRAEIWQQPVTAVNDNLAQRDFVVRYSDVFRGLGIYAEDLKLYKIGNYDSDTGVVEVLPHKLLRSGIGNVEDYII